MSTADDVGAQVDVDVEEPAELLLDPVEPDLAVPPEQWEVLADEETESPPAPTFGPPGPDSGPDEPKVEEGEAPPVGEAPEPPAPPIAVPVLHHVVEAPAIEPEPEPEPEREPEPEPEREPEFAVFEPAAAPVYEAPTPAPAPPPIEVHEPVAPAAPPLARPAAIEKLAPTERATSAMVLLLLAVVVGIALAGLVSAVVLVLTVLIRRALGA